MPGHNTLYDKKAVDGPNVWGQRVHLTTVDWAPPQCAREHSVPSSIIHDLHPPQLP